MRWLSIYLGAVGLLNVLATIVLMIVVGVTVRGRPRALGVVGFGAVALGGLISALSGLISSAVAGNVTETVIALAVVHVIATIAFLGGLVLIGVALVAAPTGSRRIPGGGEQIQAGPAVYGLPPQGQGG